MARRFIGRGLLLAALTALAACDTTQDGVLTLQGVLSPEEFPDCDELSGACPDSLFCAQLVNLPDVERSPPICLGADICSRVTCDRGQCQLTDTFPVLVRCAL